MSDVKYHEVDLIGGKPPKTLLVRYMLLEDIAKATGLCQVYRDRWWVMHPMHGIAFGQVGRTRNSGSWGFPQCNTSFKVSNKIVHLDLWKDHLVGFIPMVIVPSKPSEWSGQ